MKDDYDMTFTDEDLEQAINWADTGTAALDRLLVVARGDTGQSGIVARFLMSWWNAEALGGFNLTELWSVDGNIASDIQTVIEYIRRIRSYPDSLGYGEQFQEIVRQWR